MDTVTHGITGALIAKSFFSEREGRIATLAVTLGSIFPDSDTFAALFYSDRIEFLKIHRGITHSLVMLPAWALLFGVATSLLARQKKRWPLFSLFYAVGIGSHILLDVITSYGTMVWSPLSRVRVSWDMIFIIDLVFTSIALLPQLTAWVYSNRRRARMRAVAVWFGFTAAAVAASRIVSHVHVPLSAWTVPVTSAVVAVVVWMPFLRGRGFRWRRPAFCQAGLTALGVYLGLCAIAHQTALARVERFAKASQLAVKQIAAIPAPPSLFHWSGLVESAKGVYHAPIDLLHSGAAHYRFFATTADSRDLQAAEALPDVKTYLWFARFPWVTSQDDDGFHILEFKDVQFFWPSRRGEPPFTYRVLLDGNGRIVSAGLLRR